MLSSSGCVWTYISEVETLFVDQKEIILDIGTWKEGSNSFNT